VAQLFLPTASKAKQIELRAIEIRTKYAYGPYQAINPFELAARMGVVLVADTWLEQHPELSAELASIAGSWSAGSLPVGDKTYILLNPDTSRARQSPTLGEELAHIALGHPKSKLINVDGLAIRTCDHAVEGEAYAVATALLMPYRSLFNHLNDGHPLEELATLVPVSQACREFRVKTAGLWNLHQARARARAQQS
jgi:Zn-dependent peptidase ImmA (M78 family)